jgi:hypothetical protein
MHNWLEGVLEHQLRVLWGIGWDAKRARSLAELDKDNEDLWMDDDISLAGGEEESQDVLDDEQNFDPVEFEKWRDDYLRATYSDFEDDESSTPRGTPPLADDDPMNSSNSANIPVPESVPEDETDEDEMDDPEDDAEFEDVAVWGSWKFSKEQIAKIHSCISEVSLPT